MHPLLLLAALPLASPVRPPDTPAFLRVEVEPVRPVVGELFAVRIEFGFEASFLDEQLVSLVPRHLELPVQVRAPWLGGTDCALALPGSDPPAGPTLVIGDGIGRASAGPAEERDGATFRTFTIEREYRALCPGTLLLDRVHLRFASSGSFEDDLVGRPVPGDVRTHDLDAPPVEVRIADLPELGRPPDFHGLVGPLDASAEASPRDLTVGEDLTLSVTIVDRSGRSLAGLPAPTLPPLEGFRLLGSIERASSAAPPPGTRIFDFELAPTSERVRAVPPIELPYFDPTEGGAWRVLSLPAIPILVRPAPTAGSDPVEVPAAEPRPDWSVPAPAGLALALLLLLMIFSRRPRRP